MAYYRGARVPVPEDEDSMTHRRFGIVLLTALVALPVMLGAQQAVRQPGATLSEDEIRAYLRQRVADYKVPRTIEFRAGLPREDSGKLFKRKLHEPYWRAAGRNI